MSLEPGDLGPYETPDWHHAMRAIHRLAAARDTIEAEMSASLAPVRPTPRKDQPPRNEPPPRGEYLARDLADIAAAARELRRAEPHLAPWSAPEPRSPQARSPHTVWMLIGVIWTSAALLVGLSVLAITRAV